MRCEEITAALWLMMSEGGRSGSTRLAAVGPAGEVSGADLDRSIEQRAPLPLAEGVRGHRQPRPLRHRQKDVISQTAENTWNDWVLKKERIQQSHAYVELLGNDRRGVAPRKSGLNPRHRRSEACTARRKHRAAQPLK